MVSAAARTDVSSDVEDRVWRLLASVPDPEIPVISVVDLGIVRYVRTGGPLPNHFAAQSLLRESPGHPSMDARSSHATSPPLRRGGDSYPLPRSPGEGQGGGDIEVGISPTYSGCPATEFIKASVKQALHDGGYPAARVVDVLSPPWTSDWITEHGREQLKNYGISPPEKSVDSPRALFARPPVACPRCNSTQTQRISEFGSTPCKAHYRCLACAEPFDHFKCI